MHPQPSTYEAQLGYPWEDKLKELTQKPDRAKVPSPAEVCAAAIGVIKRIKNKTDG